MANKVVKFQALKTIKKPVEVKFRTRDGQIVVFGAIQTIQAKLPVVFKVRQKRK